jgi:hypothetical protein
MTTKRRGSGSLGQNPKTSRPRIRAQIANAISGILCGWESRSRGRLRSIHMTEWRDVRFDGRAVLAALDAERQARGMSWTQAVADINAASDPRFFARNHPIDVATVKRIEKWGDCGCHFALSYLSWLKRTPESFLVGVDEPVHEEFLPPTRPDRRLRWDLAALADAVDERRFELNLSRPKLAALMGCSASQVNLRALRYGTGMSLTMRLSQWLDRPAARFVIQATW